MSTREDCARYFPDDPSVSDEVSLLRRIPHWHFYFDPKLGLKRPRSAAFEDDKDGDPMSVYRRDVIDAGNSTVQRVMIGHEGYGLVGLSAAQFRAKNQTVFPDPLPEESSHAKICGPKPESTRRWFAKQATWVIAPPP